MPCFQSFDRFQSVCLTLPSEVSNRADKIMQPTRTYRIKNLSIHGRRCTSSGEKDRAVGEEKDMTGGSQSPRDDQKPSFRLAFGHLMKSPLIRQRQVSSTTARPSSPSFRLRPHCTNAKDRNRILCRGCCTSHLVCVECLSDFVAVRDLFRRDRTRLGEWNFANRTSFGVISIFRLHHLSSSTCIEPCKTMPCPSPTKIPQHRTPFTHVLVVRP